MPQALSVIEILARAVAITGCGLRYSALNNPSTRWTRRYADRFLSMTRAARSVRSSRR